MEWCPDEKAKEYVRKIDIFYYKRAVHIEDYRLPSVHEFINGVSVPYHDLPYKKLCFTSRHLSHVPTCDPSPPLYNTRRGRDRNMSPPPRDHSRSFRYKDATTVESNNGGS
jgi:hypothetical protein